MLREKFLAADVGITGANFLVAETGTSVIVTNEGNGDLTQTLPRAHIVLASIEKLVPTLEDLAQFLRVLARSATGQEMSVYTTLSTGPRRPDDPDGPGEYHVVLLDNGRSAMLAGEFRDMLRCIRCGACMNHCPVYHAVGGHAYGWVYPGPMGAVLTPSLIGIDKAGHLPNASTFCGRCEEVCPVRIPLPRMMRSWREREFERHLSPATVRAGLAVLGVLRQAPAALRLRDRDRGAAAGTRRAARAAVFHGCRSPPAGPAIAISRRPRARPSSREWKRSRRAALRRPHAERAASISERRHDPARPHLRDHPPLARRHRAPRRRGGSRSRRGSPDIRAASCRRADDCRRGERLDLFARMVEAASGTVERVADAAADIPAAVADFLRGHNLPLRLRHGDDPRLAACPGGTRPRSRSAAAASDGNDLAAVSHAFAAVAETGTVVLISGADNPTTLNFLPDVHIVVVERRRHRRRFRDGHGAPARALRRRRRCRAPST